MTTLGVKITHGVGLQSKGATKGGRPRPSQPGHWDYCQDTIRRHHVVQRQKRIQQTWPWTVLISLQPEGLLWVFSAGVWKLLSLREGDAVLVRGDVWHAGAGYVEEHWRVHFYCEPIHAEDPTLQFRADDGGELTLHGLLRNVGEDAVWSGKNARRTPSPIDMYTGKMYTLSTLPPLLGMIYH